MIRQALIIADEIPLSAFARVASDTGDHTLLDCMILHLAAFGVEEVLLYAWQAVDEVQRYDGVRLGGAQVQTSTGKRQGSFAEILWSLRGRLDERFVVVGASFAFCDLTAFVTAPLSVGSEGGWICVEGQPGAEKPTIYYALLARDRALAVRLDHSGVGPRTLAAYIKERHDLGLMDVRDESADHDGSGSLARRQIVLGRPAAFLDRDGVINVDRGFTVRPEDLTFTPTAIEAIRILNRVGYRVLVVSNQSGIARGFFDRLDVEGFHRHMQRQLLSHGAHIDAFYYCAFHPDGSVPAYAVEHQDRKPNPGMLLQGMREWSIRRRGTFMIGDKASDVEAAVRAGVPGLRVTADICDLAAEVRRMLAADPAGSLAAVTEVSDVER